MTVYASDISLFRTDAVPNGGVAPLDTVLPAGVVPDEIKIQSPGYGLGIKAMVTKQRIRPGSSMVPDLAEDRRLSAKPTAGKTETAFLK
ncbi:MAG: hypothetical protein U0U70_09205 [Chitinophagaceae bacterium]